MKKTRRVLNSLGIFSGNGFGGINSSYRLLRTSKTEWMGFE